MKKLTVAVLAGLVATSAFAEKDGDVHFTGKVINQTCAVDAGAADAGAENKGKGTGEKNQTVVLGQVPLSELSAKGETTGRTNFIIKLTNCIGPLSPPKSGGDYSASKNGTSVHAAWIMDGSVDPDTGFIKNTATEEPAQKVQLKLYDSASNPIDIRNGADTLRNDPGVQLTSVDSEGNVALTYSVRYVATDAGATAGNVTGRVGYSIVYK